MLIAARNGFLAGKHLPYDAEVEYLESTGTQWIDTGVNAKQSLKIASTFYAVGPSSYFVYGVRAGNTTITAASGVYGASWAGAVRWGNSSFVEAIPGGLVSMTQDANGVTVNGNFSGYNATQTVTEQSGYTITVFAGRNSVSSVTANLVGKIYVVQIWDDGVLVRDFIPVRVGTTGAMYDRLGTGGMNPDGSARTDGLYFNCGTGAFVIGPDK